ncbi:DUF1272 domain-containing protein [Aliiglaciecola litoralis]|uniref:DUF1272 domain-containing protein n=1 Tax=Aliiglaciecola litoralis TaxID=582857 RepID=A0ABN1LCV0_9ALTE
MLQLRPNYELCDKDLPADSDEACICSYECTFCRTCVDAILKNVCSNCGGEFVSRPIRLSVAHRTGVSLAHHPASCERIRSQFSTEQIKAFVEQVKVLENIHE